ncbi:hypothetical protein SLEP1_g24276 [Rubroshorea leprosula]|uniref:Uncharacterized protein n=1 Tax=Rubroshorea leprosula TaxID=152421 RepID=A0AAV5JPG4_9ROSI|nr:hypothetical protein SLEP1_g24276 [Rubroshorea leprosula]
MHASISQKPTVQPKIFSLQVCSFLRPKYVGRHFLEVSVSTHKVENPGEPSASLCSSLFI